MSKENIGVAVAGLGFVGGQAHVPAIRKVPGAELVAVIDINEELAKKVADKYDVLYYKNFSKALENPEIDALILAVPTPVHYELCSEAITHGKHILCEMPLTATITESEKLRDQAKKAGVILMPDLNFRFTPIYVKAKELIDQGAIGEPIAVTANEFIAAKDLEAQWPADSWAWDAKKSGGLPDFTLSVWSIDLLRWLLGKEITDIKWFKNYAPLEGFGKWTGYNTVSIIQFSNGAVGTLHYGSTVVRGEGTSKIEVYGNNTKVIQAIWNNSLTLTGEGSEKQHWDIDARGTKAWGHRQIEAYFVECILQGKKPSVTVDDAIICQSLSGKILEI